MNVNELETGDLVLIESITPCACCVSLWSRSNINHVGMILKDIELSDVSLKGTFIIEAGLELVEDVKGNKLPFGTQIQSLETFKPQSINMYIRKLKVDRNETFLNKVRDIYNTIRNAPYDLRISVWSELFETVVLDKDIKNITTINQAEKQKYFTCSAMIAYILTKLNYSILNTVNGNWNMITPKFFKELKEAWLEEAKLFLF